MFIQHETNYNVYFTFISSLSICKTNMDRPEREIGKEPASLKSKWVERTRWIKPSLRVICLSGDAIGRKGVNLIFFILTWRTPGCSVHDSWTILVLNLGLYLGSLRVRWWVEGLEILVCCSWSLFHTSEMLACFFTSYFLLFHSH